jgi:hypothetical protein
MNNYRSHRIGAARTFTPAAICTAAALSALVGCSRSQGADADAVPERARAETLYTARLQPLNTSVTGSKASGEVTFGITGDKLTITTDASGLPPGMAHWQHFHGFKDGRDAACPTDTADANGDGIIDLLETEPVAGTTMVPFNADPVAMDIPHDSYPTSTATGTLSYKKEVSFDALQSTFGKSFDGQELNLDARVVFLHGVPSEAALAASVASLGPIPAQVTIPIACGEIRRVK